MLKTELIEELERDVQEFGDGPVKVPDPMQPGWYNPVDRLERGLDDNSALLVNDN